MKLDLPGLTEERQRSGAKVWRVRVQGKRGKKINIGVSPDHPEFMEIYRAARQGEKLAPTPTPLEQADTRTLEWLTLAYEAHMAKEVEIGALDPKTLSQRAGFYKRLRAEYGNYPFAMPQRSVYAIRDNMMSTPGAADNMVKAIRAMYRWAMKRGFVQDNPAAGVEKINHGTGATPWSTEDLKAFKKVHPFGTTPHLALTLFMFTACRLEDARLLGREHEKTIQGVRHIEWQPDKRGSSPVSVPIMPPLQKALDARKVLGSSYLLNAHGAPFASNNALGNWFRKQCLAAGLKGRSPHGIRKATGTLLAEHGLSQYHVMAIHGHTNAKTSEVYTRGADRRRLASEAMAAFASLDW